MIVKETGGETRLTFGLKEWLAIGAILVSSAYYQSTTRSIAVQNRDDIQKVAKSLREATTQLNQLIRVDERLKSLEAWRDRQRGGVD